MEGTSIEHLLVWGGLLLLVSILASKVSSHLGVPALLLFLAIGMLAGSEGPGNIYFDDAWVSQLLGVVALTFILFSGGLDTKLAAMRPVFAQGIALSTLGVLITALSIGWFSTLILDFSLTEGILLGSIVSSTDAAAVFSMLRGRNIGLKGHLKPLLEMESGSNDPMAIFLTLGLIRLLDDPAVSVFDLVPMFVQQMALGVLIGYLSGRGIAAILNRARLEHDGLYPVLTIALALLTYGITTSLGGNGFLAVYLAGVIAGNRNLLHKNSLLRFHEGLAWLMQITMFLTLGLLVFPSQIVPVAADGLLISLALLLVARPLAVFISLVWTRLRVREKGFIAWVGLRGAAPIILATFPMLADLPNAGTIFNLVFFTVLTSVLVQGTTLTLVAKKLGVDNPAPAKPSIPIEFSAPDSIKSELIEVTISPDAPIAGEQIVNIPLPQGTLIVLLGRDNDFIIPGGSTRLQPGDTLLVWSHRENIAHIRALVQHDTI